MLICEKQFSLSFGSIRTLAIVSESDASGEFYSLQTILFATQRIDSEAFASCHLKYIIKNVRNATRRDATRRVGVSRP